MWRRRKRKSPARWLGLKLVVFQCRNSYMLSSLPLQQAMDEAIMKRRTVTTARFKAKGESGRIYEIIEQADQLFEQPLSGPGKWKTGTKEYLVSTGGSANKISDTEFHIVLTEENATRI